MDVFGNPKGLTYCYEYVYSLAEMGRKPGQMCPELDTSVSRT